MERKNNLLEISQFKLDFGQGDVLKGVDLSINKGEIVALVGESGSGKSLTAMSIMQLLDRSSFKSEGQIIFDKENQQIAIDSENEVELQKIRGKDISIVFQNPMSSLNPSKRCGHQVEEIIKIHYPLSAEDRKKQVLSLFAEVKLSDVERMYKSYPHQLSGGQLQRVMIAMAIANKPSLILADEPTTALDVTVQKEVLYLLKH